MCRLHYSHSVSRLSATSPRNTPLTPIVAIVLLYRLAMSPWSIANSKFSWRRVLRNSLARYLGSSLNAGQLQYADGSTFDKLTAWAEQNKCDYFVEDIGQGGRLIWMGKKRIDRVILYAHSKCVAFIFGYGFLMVCI